MIPRHGTFKLSDPDDSLKHFKGMLERSFLASKGVVSLIGIGLIAGELRLDTGKPNILLVAITGISVAAFFILGKIQIKKLLLAFEKSWLEINDTKFIFFHEDNEKRINELEILRSEDWKIIKLRHVHAYQIEAPIWPVFPFFKKTHILSIATNQDLAKKILEKVFQVP